MLALCVSLLYVGRCHLLQCHCRTVGAADRGPEQIMDDKKPDTREAAKRALAEAEARRAKAPPSADAPREILGREGPEPTRYGDWEHKGLISDF